MPGECRGLPGECKGVGVKYQRNEGECRGMPGERTRVEAKCQGNAEECRGMQGNTGECQGNVWEWVQSAREMLGNATATYGSGAVPGECRKCWGMPGERMGVGAKCQGNVVECKGMPGNIWEWVQSARGMQVNATATYGSGAVPGEHRKCWGMPGERMGVGTKCQGNVGECKGMPGNIWEWVQSAMGMHGSVQSAMGMWEDARGMYGCGCKSQKKAGECREREHMGFGTKCQENASECRGMLGNTRGTYGSGRNARGIQWNAGKCKGMPGK